MELQLLKSKIEAVLFTTAKALQAKEIAEILGTEVEETENALLELIMDYSSREGALEIDDEDGYILQVRQEHLDIVEKLCPVELKPAVLKTLTVIALKEPIRQSYLKELRGANAYEHVAELLETILEISSMLPKIWSTALAWSSASSAICLTISKIFPELCATASNPVRI